MLNLYKLEIFAVVAEEGSFTAAAERMLMTQSGISQHIQDLEGALGTRLFHRGRRGVTLTPEGEMLYDYTLRILSLVTEAENAVTDVRHLESGVLQLGATPGISAYLLPSWVGNFRQGFANITTELFTGTTSDVVDRILKRSLDIGFVEGELHELEHEHLARFVLRDIHLYVVVGDGHDWQGRDEIGIEELAGKPFISRQRGSQTRIWTDELLSKYDIQPNIVAEFDNLESIKGTVASGMGVSILPEYAIQNSPLHHLTLADIPMQRSVKLLWHDNYPLNAITRVFLETLSEECPQLEALV